MSASDVAAPDRPGITVGEALEKIGEPRPDLTVRLSKELITLLSEQLYTSASKAIEELVVNSFDADATVCRVVVPGTSFGTSAAELPVIAVYDDGAGMDETGLADLWRVGASTKRTEQVERIRKRTQIGKFGIGKLATYALASRITYITSTGNGEILAVSLSFEAFQSGPTGEADEPVILAVRRLTTEDLAEQQAVAHVCKTSGIVLSEELTPDRHWTLVLLEEFKPQAAKLSAGRLRWVLSTAMPISNFELYLNGEQVQSRLQARVDNALVSFSPGDLPQERIDRLETLTGEQWELKSFTTSDGSEVRLASDTLPAGVGGRVFVTDETIYGGKSTDLTRSHGFFVRVRGRLIAEDDPLFGLTPLSYEVFNRFRADIEVDDLDADLTAPREGAGTSDRVLILQHVLTQLYNEARSRYDEVIRQRFRQGTKREDKRQYVYPRFVERPVADALLSSTQRTGGAASGQEADEAWFYMTRPSAEKLDDIASGLYSVEDRDPFQFRLEEGARAERLVSFDPESRTFTVNSEHELALAFADTKQSLDLLYDVAVAETLLEVYLREAGLAPHLIGDVLERRDGLLRSLAREQVNSPAAIAALLRDATAKDRDLEVAMVVAARALGFVAKHIGNSDRADGIARFTDYPNGERKITLEAKSSTDVPSLGALDFAGLQNHKEVEKADGCLVIAPSYPGGTRGEDAQAAQRAVAAKVSCWTIEQLAQVVASLASRDITARDVLGIVLHKYAPEDVTAAVNALLADSANAPRELAVSILRALRVVEQYAPADAIRSLDMIRVELGRMGINAPLQEAKDALRQLVGASGGTLTLLSDDRILYNASLEEVERRTAPWAANSHTDRHASTFHDLGRGAPEV
ncbi:ATP-binding protein [Microbacterium sp. 22296]|uniref:ATP-binding protein n=1 Tax=Microbacterium sp. 22296 TaxID=3453903 RepID=UPI003F84B820